MNSRRALLGTLVGAAVLLLVGVVGMHTPAFSLQALPLGIPGDRDAVSVEMRFERGDRLAPGAEVRYGQAVVGRVAGVRTDGADALVDVVLAPDSGVAADTFAEVRLPTALGTPEIALTPAAEGSAGPIDDGAVVGRDRTGVGPDVESALGAVGLLLNGSGIDQLGTVMSELTSALGGRGPELGRIRERTERAAELYTVHRDDLERTVDGLDRMADAVAVRRDLLERGMATSGELMTEAARSRDTIADLLGTTTELVQQSGEFLDGTEGRVTPTVDTLDSLMRDMAGFGDRVRPTLDALVEFVDNFDPALRGDHMLFDGALDIPGSLDALDTRGKARTGEDGVTELPEPDFPPLPGRSGPVDPVEGG